MARPGFMVLHAALDILAGEPPEVVGAYVLVHQYIARKNLSGRMVGARTWSDGVWRCACRISRRHAEQLVKSGGARWDADDLVLEHYDQHGETKYGGQVKRVAVINEKRTTSSPKSPPKSAPISSPKSPADIGGGTAGAWAGAEDSPASPPSGLPPRDDDGDDRKYSPHDHQAEAPEPPPADRRHLTTAIIRRVDGVDEQDVRTAAKAGSLVGVVTAFGANASAHRQAEWRREADGYSLLSVLVLFADARRRGVAIREPSGLRAAIEHRLGQIEREHADELLALYGLKAPTPAKASA